MGSSDECLMDGLRKISRLSHKHGGTVEVFYDFYRLSSELGLSVKISPFKNCSHTTEFQVFLLFVAIPRKYSQEH